MSRYRSGTNLEFTHDVLVGIRENCPHIRIYGMGGRWRIAYGFDHAMAWFVQFYPCDDKAQEYLNEREDDIDCIGFDYVFDNLTGYELGYILKLFNCQQEHIDACFLDLEF